MRSLMILALTIGGSAIAQPLELVVDQAQSSIDLSITISTTLGDRTSSDNSAVTGRLLYAVDDPGAPASTVLYDLELELVSSLEFSWSYGFLGSASAQLNDGAFRDNDPNQPKGPVPVVAGAFEIPDVPLLGEGIADTSYNFLLVGAGSGTLDLAEAGVLPGTFSGTVSIVGNTVTVTSPFDIEGTTDLPDMLGTATYTGTGVVVAVGTLPTCAADLAAPFGVLNFFDLGEFLALFTAQDPAADFFVDGTFNFFDLGEFLTQFSAACAND